MPDKKKVIMVDDDRGACLLVRDILEKTGEFTVIATSDAKEGEGLCYKEKPDLILLDNVMPEKKGSDIVKALKNNDETKGTPIIMISGKGEMIYSPKKQKFEWLPNNPTALNRGQIVEGKDPEQLSKAYGVNDYIAKPFTAEILIEVIKNVLEKKQKQSET